MIRTKLSGRAPLARFAIVAGLLATALTALPTEASAQNANLRWTCRASMAYVLVPGLDRIEPVFANGRISAVAPNEPFCRDDQNATPTLNVNANPIATIVTSNAVAATVADPDVFLPGATSVAAATYVDSSRIGLVGDALRLETGITRSFAVGTCGANQQTQFTGFSEVVGLRVNEQNVPVDEVLEVVGDGLNALLGSVIRVSFNERVKTGGPSSSEELLIHRAVNIQALGLQAVLGESQVGRVGNVCDPRATINDCPPNSTFDPLSGYCLRQIEVPGINGRCPLGATKLPDGRCVLVFAVGPGDPTGGTIVPVNQVPGGRTSPCRSKRFGKSNLAVVGTNRRDKITGSNGRDRIFVFGGNDRVSGGRGADCIDGGTGRDQLDGDAGSDYLLGRSGRDTLNGGSKNDRIEGNSGHDSMNGGSGKDHLIGGTGRDKIVGGSGNDLLRGGPERDYLDDGQGRDRLFGEGGGDWINVAIAGKPSRVNCGPGPDRLRINQNERRRIRGCETVHIIF